MRPNLKKRTIIVHANDLEVKSAPSTHPKIQDHRGRKEIRILYKPNLIAILLGILSFGLAAILYLFYKISRKK